MILKLIWHYLRHPKELAAGLARKFKRGVKRVTGIGKMQEKVQALEEALAKAEKENRQLAERVERLEISRTIRKKSALETLAREAAEEGAEARAKDPKRLEAYGKVFAQVKGTGEETACAVDLGCGRGVWMKVLAEQGFSVVGVDNEEKYVSACREQKMNAVCADEAEWVRDCQSGAQDLVVVEKAEAIGLERVAGIITEAARVLRPHGALIIESGENKIGTPIKADTITTIAKQVGFKPQTMKFEKDFAVIGSKE